ncbi:hypothetical protein [Ideonella sp. YS5]|uniref:hypothetical protein n=1 Tax=Ideonella sp. YS5 TaxID=3453714 RepID=UPI003EEB4FEE
MKASKAMQRVALLLCAVWGATLAQAQTYEIRTRPIMRSSWAPGESVVWELTQLWGDPNDETAIDPQLRKEMEALRAGPLQKLYLRAKDEAGWIQRSESGGTYEQSGLRSAARMMNWAAMAAFTLPLEHRITLARASLGLLDSVPACGVAGWHGVAWAEVGEDTLTRISPADRTALVAAWAALLKAATEVRSLPQRPATTMADRIRTSGETLPAPLAARWTDRDAGGVLGSGEERALDCALAAWWWPKVAALPTAAQGAEVDAMLLTAIDNELGRIDLNEPAPHFGRFDHTEPGVEGFPPYAWRLGLRAEVTVRVRLDAKLRPLRAEVLKREIGSPAWLHGDLPLLPERLFDRASRERAFELMMTPRQDGKPRNPDGEDFLLAWNLK